MNDRIYTIFDLDMKAQYHFDTREKVAACWTKLAGRTDFSELNLSGGFQPEHGRYIVYCCGRPVDIRRWPDSVWQAAAPKPMNEVYFGHSGKKTPIRRCSGPSMYRSKLRAACDDSYTDSDELAVAYPVPPVRNKSKKDLFLYAGDERMWDLSNSWKRRSRCKKQYMRHKGKHSNTTACCKRVIDPEWLEAFDDGALAA